MCKVGKEVFGGKNILAELNKTLIMLIPKIKKKKTTLQALKCFGLLVCILFSIR